MLRRLKDYAAFVGSDGWVFTFLTLLALVAGIATRNTLSPQPEPRYTITLEGGAMFYTDALENRDGIVVFTADSGRRVTTTTAHVVSISERVK